MSAWLHFVGKQYYSEAAFIREAEKFGITRRISPGVLKEMKGGDVVLLAQFDGRMSKVFGSFVVNGISGLSEVAINRLREKNLIGEKINEGGFRVSRGCGSYLAGPTYQMNADINEITQFLEKEECPNLMVSGIFKKISPFFLKDVPFRPGFRRFDLEAWKEAKPVKFRKGLPVYQGQFYTSEESQETKPLLFRVAQSVFSYERAQA